MYIPGEALLPHKQYHLEQALKIRALFEKVTAGEGISAEWRQEESELPNISQNVIKSAHAADLVILGQANEDKDDANIREVAGDVLMECGRPVLLVPYSGTFAEIGYHILVGWNGSWESARAVFDALPFLKSVNQVHLHWAALVQPDSEEKIILGADLAATLARHGVKVSAETNFNPGLSDCDELLSYVRQRGADRHCHINFLCAISR